MAMVNNVPTTAAAFRGIDFRFGELGRWRRQSTHGYGGTATQRSTESPVDDAPGLRVAAASHPARKSPARGAWLMRASSSCAHA